MAHYQSKKWQLFGSRPTSILKRDFLKWAYLSADKIRGLKVTKLAAISDQQEMDLFINAKEDQKNYLTAVKRCKSGKTDKIFQKYHRLMNNYQPRGNDPVKNSLTAMKDVGPPLIYTFYVERSLEKNKNERLAELNGKLRDRGAKIIYPFYDKAHDFLQNKFGARLVDNYTLEELKHSLDKKAINQRQKFYIFVGTKKGTKVYTGEAAKKWLRQNGFKAIKLQNKRAKELVGLTACLGKVKGEVKIVRGLNDVKDCAEKVVVSRETIIEYAPFLKKALAIVTDLGGLTCHAAIVSREFNIPCVVGTKIATQVLKDGDTVEVDANRGIVKIIE